MGSIPDTPRAGREENKTITPQEMIEKYENIKKTQIIMIRNKPPFLERDDITEFIDGVLKDLRSIEEGDC